MNSKPKSADVNQVLQLFKERVLAASIAPYVVKIIHFGSTLKGFARPESDIDVLVVSSNGRSVEEGIAEIAFEIQMDYGVGLEPIVDDLDDLISGSSYFLYNILKYGKELYTMNKNEIKKEASKHFLQLAEEYLQAAKDALKAKHPRLAVDAAYNAAELAIKALLLKKIDDLPGSHGGLVGKFGELFVKTGSVDKGLGREINLALEKRNSARYKYQAVISTEDAGGVIQLAKQVIDLYDSIK